MWPLKWGVSQLPFIPLASQGFPEDRGLAPENQRRWPSHRLLGGMPPGQPQAPSPPTAGTLRTHLRAMEYLPLPVSLVRTR